MARRLLSHLLISLAVFVLTATFFMWTIDARVLEPVALSGELRKAGVSKELASLMPQIVTADEEASEIEKLDMTQKISQAVTADYVEKKIMAITESVLTFVRTGEPQPVIDLSDFPDQLIADGVDVGSDINDKFSEPIKLNENGDLDKIHEGYQVFNMVKVAGIFLFALIMLIEWFVAERGKKLRRLSRVFLYAGISYLLYWVALIVAPMVFGDKLRSSVQAEYDASGLVDAVIKAVQGMFSLYFLVFAVTCLGIATILYIIRHYKHGDVLPSNAPTLKKSK